MSAAPRFSLWLVPEPIVAARLESRIAELAARHGGPEFVPHVTLWSSLSDEAAGVALARALAAESGAIDVVGDRLEGTDELHRNLYLRFTNETALADLHARAAARLGAAIEAPYLPHLSLFYGKLDGAGRARASAELTGSLPIDLTLDALELWSTAGNAERWRCSVRCPVSR